MIFLYEVNAEYKESSFMIKVALNYVEGCEQSLLRLLSADELKKYDLKVIDRSEGVYDIEK